MAQHQFSEFLVCHTSRRLYGDSIPILASAQMESKGGFPVGFPCALRSRCLLYRQPLFCHLPVGAASWRSIATPTMSPAHQDWFITITNTVRNATCWFYKYFCGISIIPLRSTGRTVGFTNSATFAMLHSTYISWLFGIKLLFWGCEDRDSDGFISTSPAGRVVLAPWNAWSIPCACPNTFIHGYNF